jgi:hypothetical protein
MVLTIFLILLLISNTVLICLLFIGIQNQKILLKNHKTFLIQKTYQRLDEEKRLKELCDIRKILLKISYKNSLRK